ncbi:MAG: hypothetical protein J6C46_01315 [Clostridia bacterium]|nr:hypothetical protein [Clostridia bacterium]
MLTAEQRLQIRNTQIYRYTTVEEDGVPVTNQGISFSMPDFDKIRDRMIEKLAKKGFSKFERVKPSKANCILRVFKITHEEYDGLMFNAYGAYCYTKECGKWFTLGNNGKIGISYSSFEIRHWIFQDEYVDLNFDFFDCYVKVS